jgi:ribosomal 50S subunit-recycling heat shock protein
MGDKLQIYYNNSMSALKVLIIESHKDDEERASLFYLKPSKESSGQGYSYLADSCYEFVRLAAKVNLI